MGEKREIFGQRHVRDRTRTSDESRQRRVEAHNARSQSQGGTQRRTQ